VCQLCRSRWNHAEERFSDVLGSLTEEELEKYKEFWIRFYFWRDYLCFEEGCRDLLRRAAARSGEKMEKSPMTSLYEFSFNKEVDVMLVSD
jgi:hypothetical protein